MIDAPRYRCCGLNWRRLPPTTRGAAGLRTIIGKRSHRKRFMIPTADFANAWHLARALHVAGYAVWVERDDAPAAKPLMSAGRQ